MIPITFLLIRLYKLSPTLRFLDNFFER